ncbi:divalent-cation tolerance protein CutA [Basilea psittacipulmonis]|uniref:Dihydroorotate dehydrogenase n=1 Tax=Basilea psittacipulmonis DSM 24701 TaxID=1072685 RepID=A0A077DEU1_9BURK|nr:divalent-cation tolerance protein CutA [Basilea psittacipulmonis]AIL33355.1 hypothetical protein IX83_08625 [Basilea psittacipulmonis DSM 24701]
MKDLSACVLIMTAVPDLLTAKRIAHQTVEHGMAACAHISPAGLSVYMWEGKLQAESEMQLLIKTTQAKQEACVQEIKLAHPYEIPEIVVMPIVGGLPEYLSWVAKEVASHD